jgi:tRNA pseudouridine32 synthase/23S rRNA pseudouridine746 synthase/23S rRNA pseudouridine1911/1915/1917 synthase
LNKRGGRPAGRSYRNADETLAAFDLRDRVLYRDSQMIVIDKPAGLPVHAGPKAKHGLESLLDQLKFGLSQVPIPAHRLDQDTGGCLVLARNERARSKLGRLFAAGRIEKVYWAIVTGTPAASEGRVDLPLRKITGRQGWRMVTDMAGQSAVTDYRVLRRIGDHAWLELRPRTGRTHQVRVHCAALGCPIVGDPVYGQESSGALHLFARSLRIPFYEGRAPIEVVAAPPPHMQALLESRFDFSGALRSHGVQTGERA